MNQDNQNSLVPINDLLAVNNLPLRERDFIEWMDELMSARIKVPFVIVVSVSALFYAIILASVLLNMKVVSPFLVAVVSGCLLIALFFRYAVSRLLGRLRYNQYCLSRNECPGATAFYIDHLELRAGNEIITRLAYSNIKKITLTEDLIIISFPHLTNCVVRRDGFTEKDFEIILEQIKIGMRNGDFMQ